MKTTSYEISKKLVEEGFEAKTEFYWIELNGDLILIRETQLFSVPFSLKKIPAYDLETILDALKQTRKRIMIEIKSDNWGINFNYEFNKYSQKNESLADTAGRMWLMLKERGIIC